MISVYGENKDVSHRFDLLDAEGATVATVSASYDIYDEDNQLVSGNISVDVATSPDFVLITIPAADNQVPPGALRAFRTIRLSYVDDEGVGYSATLSYVIETASQVQVGLNSFETYGRLMMEAMAFSNMDALMFANEADRTKALLNAWYNIGNLRVDVGLEGIHTTMGLGSAELVSLDSQILKSLVRAQIVEANALLGGNPIEDRRRMGLISDSAGESAHFFRTTRPIDLPVSKDTATQLNGLICWGVKLGRT